ncbi:MAG: hypothetical protein LBT04_08305, partial [Prevotellaceae bacterium]|nr:hypothetical protein [Prevotellaceae bacterium]
IVEKKKERINEKNETLKVKDFDFEMEKSKRLIVSYSSKRTEKDRHDREKAVEKLREKLAKSNNPASLISNYGYKKFLSVQGEVQITVDEEKMAQQALWDGLHGIFYQRRPF